MKDWQKDIMSMSDSEIFRLRMQINELQIQRRKIAEFLKPLTIEIVEAEKRAIRVWDRIKDIKFAEDTNE